MGRVWEVKIRSTSRSMITLVVVLKLTFCSVHDGDSQQLMLPPLPITEIADVEVETFIAFSEGVWNDADSNLHFRLAASKIHTSYPLPTITS